MDRKWTFLISIVLLVGLGYATFESINRSDTDEEELQRVTVAQVGQFFLYMPLYFAIERGYFRENGLDVQIINSGGDEKSVAAVITGDADFGVGDPTFAAIARASGQDVNVIASVVNGVPFWGVTKSREIPSQLSPRQLQNIVVATFPRPSTAYVLQQAMFEEGGHTPTIREAQFGSLLPLLDTGAVDVVLELEPNVSLALKNGARVVYSMAERHPDFAITGVTTASITIAQRPDVVSAFVSALDAAMRDAHAKPESVVRFAKEHFPDIDPMVAEAAVLRMLQSGVFPSSARVSESGWSAAIGLRIVSGDLASDDMAVHTLDNSFLPANNP